MATGTVKWFSEQKGYGFITPDDGVASGTPLTSNTVIVENTEPVIGSVDLGPSPAFESSTLSCTPMAVVDADGDATFAGYRLDLALGGLDSRASTLATKSGLRAGDTVVDLNAVYSAFTVSIFDEPEVGLFYEIVSDGGEVLLRGPVTSAEDDGIVTGIWAPDACSQ